MKNLKGKIFLKVYKWIDSFFNTYHKRKRNLTILVSLFWIWQYLWQILFFLKLNQVKDYHSLFSFMRIMDGYSASYLIQLTYHMIAKGTLSFINMAESLTSLFSFSYFFWALLTLLFCLQTNKRRLMLFGLFNLAWLFMILVLVGTGFNSSSIEDLVSVLHYLSIMGLMGSSFSLGYLLFKLVQLCCIYRKK